MSQGQSLRLQSLFQVFYFKSACGGEYPVRTFLLGSHPLFVLHDVAAIIGAPGGSYLSRRHSMQPLSRKFLIGQDEFYAAPLDGVEQAVMSQLAWVRRTAASKPFSCNCGCAASVEDFSSEMRRFVAWAHRISKRVRVPLSGHMVSQGVQRKLAAASSQAPSPRKVQPSSVSSGAGQVALALAVSKKTRNAWENDLSEQDKATVLTTVEAVSLHLGKLRRQAKSKQSRWASRKVKSVVMARQVQGILELLGMD